MQSKAVAIIFLVGAFSGHCRAAEHTMTKEEVFRLFSYSVERNSPEEFNNFLTLRDAGERAYPALAELLAEAEDPATVSNIVPVFVQSKGDKTVPLNALNKYIEHQGSKTPTKGGLFMVVRALGALGGAKEAATLRGLNDHGDILLRNAVEHSLDRIEKRLKASERRTAAMARKRDRTIGASPEMTERRKSPPGEEKAVTTAFCSYWQWLLGGIIVLAAYACFKRLQGSANTKGR